MKRSEVLAFVKRKGIPQGDNTGKPIRLWMGDDNRFRVHLEIRNDISNFNKQGYIAVFPAITDKITRVYFDCGDVDDIDMKYCYKVVHKKEYSGVAFTDREVGMILKEKGKVLASKNDTHKYFLEGRYDYDKEAKMFYVNISKMK